MLFASVKIEFLFSRDIHHYYFFFMWPGLNMEMDSFDFFLVIWFLFEVVMIKWCWHWGWTCGIFVIYLNGGLDRIWNLTSWKMTYLKTFIIDFNELALNLKVKIHKNLIFGYTVRKSSWSTQESTKMELRPSLLNLCLDTILSLSFSGSFINQNSL